MKLVDLEQSPRPVSVDDTILYLKCFSHDQESPMVRLVQPGFELADKDGNPQYTTTVRNRQGKPTL